MLYEDDFNDLISFQPIYTNQVRIIKRLAPTMAEERIFRLSADEANLFINSIRSKYIRNSWDWVNNNKRMKKREAKDRIDQEAAFEPEEIQDISEAKPVLALAIIIERISK